MQQLCRLLQIGKLANRQLDFVAPRRDLTTIFGLLLHIFTTHNIVD